MYSFFPKRVLFIYTQTALIRPRTTLVRHVISILFISTKFPNSLHFVQDFLTTVTPVPNRKRRYYIESIMLYFLNAHVRCSI